MARSGHLHTPERLLRCAMQTLLMIASLSACTGGIASDCSHSNYWDYLHNPPPALKPDSCQIAVRWGFAEVWTRADVNGRLGCPTASERSVSGTILRFGHEARIIWLRELSQFHALAGSAIGKRILITDDSELADVPPARSPVTPPPTPDFEFWTSGQFYTPQEGRFGWLLAAHPELAACFPAAIGDETPFKGVYQPFESGALFYDGRTGYVFFDDHGGWWMMI